MKLKEFIDVVEKFDVSRFAIPTSISHRLTCDDDIEIRVAMHVNDVHTGRPTTVNFVETISHEVLERLHDEVAAGIVPRLLHQALTHELDERTWYDGKQVTDPHEGERTR